MTAPRYYRRRPSMLADVAGVLLFLAIIIGATRQWLQNHDARVRAEVYQAAEQHAAATITLRRAAWQRTYDSLATLSRVRDTVLVTQIRTVRELVTRVDTVRDSSAVAQALRACTALSDDCDTFRVSATRALVAADSLRQLDSARVMTLAVGRAAASDSVARVIRQRNARPGWRVVFSTAAVSALTAYVAGVVTR